MELCVHYINIMQANRSRPVKNDRSNARKLAAPQKLY